jgi:hypothetical protein
VRIGITRRALAAIVLTLGVLVCGGVKTMAKLVNPTPASASQAVPAGKPSADDPRKAQIKALGEQIRALREQYQSQTGPLEAQIKSLREKFETELSALEARRKALVEEGESSGLKALIDEESAQLAALADREKEEIGKVHERYAEERKTIQQTFQRRRHELEIEKK